MSEDLGFPVGIATYMALAAAPTTWELWRDRAIALLERAAYHLGDDNADDAGSDASAALACIEIGSGQMHTDELLPYPFPGEEQEGPACTCPPDLVARGGFQSWCPADDHPLPATSLPAGPANIAADVVCRFCGDGHVQGDPDTFCPEALAVWDHIGDALGIPEGGC